MISLCAVAGCAATLQQQAPAQSETRTGRADRHLAAGADLLHRGQAARAATEVGAAYALLPQPGTLALLARCHDAAGQEGDADVAAHLRGDPARGDLDGLLRRRFALGREHFQAGRYDQAAAALRTAYALARGAADEGLRRKAPHFLFDIAQAHRRAHRPREALWLYQRFVEEDPRGSPRLRAEALGYIQELQLLIDAEGRAASRPPRPPPPYRQTWFWPVLTTGAAALGASIALTVVLSRQEPNSSLEDYIIRFPP